MATQFIENASTIDAGLTDGDDLYFVEGATNVTGNIDKEREVVEKHGGRVVFTKDISFSSSELINKYLDVYDRPLRDYLDSHRETGTAEKIKGLIESVKDYRVLLVGDASSTNTNTSWRWENRRRKT